MATFNDPNIIDIPDQYRLFSRTDLKGTILEANSEFIEISGYAADEIIGQPHNIIRNPEVPKAVFKDLWETIQAGESWTQIVKNKTKDGRGYWVKANVSPVFENNKITGYLSTRKPISPQEAKVAAEAYQQINQGKLVVKKGRLYTPGKYRRQEMNPYLRLGLMGKLAVIGTILVLAGTLITSIIAETNYLKAKEANQATRHETLNTLLEQQIQALGTRASNTAINFAIQPEIRQALKNNDDTSVRSTLESHIKDFNQINGDALRVHIHKPDSTSFVRSWTQKSKDPLNSFRFAVNKIAKEHKPLQVFELGRGGVAIRSISPIFAIESNEYLGSLEVMTSMDKLEKYFAKKNTHYIALLTDSALEISTDAKDNPKVGSLTLASKTEFDPEAISWLAEIDIDQLIKAGHMTSNKHYFMISPIQDARDELVGYHVLVESLTHISKLNALSADNAIMSVVQIIIAMIALMLAFILLAYFNIVRPVKTIVELMNRSVDEGDLTLRLDDRFKDEMGQVSSAYNRQMQTMQVTMAETSRMLFDVAKGNFDTHQSIPTKGDFKVISHNLSETINNIEKTFNEIRGVLTHIRDGDFHYHPKTELHGDFERAMHDALSSMAILRGVFHEVNELMGQVAEGFFTRRIESEAKGELLELKQNINASLDKLQDAIAETSQVMIAQGAGDLTRRIEGQFQGTLSILKDGINSSVTNTGSLISQSNYSLLKLSAGAQQIADDIADLSARTQQQAASLEETAASMEEITSTIKTTADNAALANEAAIESIKEANQANAVVHNTITSINEISEASAKISEITSLIDSIAFQTNLLALNAAVEAARAGDHGRGFAVVAGEVRSLAGKAADAAKDIRNLIDDTLHKVKEGAARAQESGQALEIINESISKISSFVSEISQTSNEQAKGVEQVNIAISQIDQVTQQNSALVEKTAERTAEMGRLAKEVNEVSKTFKIDLNQIGFATAMQTGMFTFAHARRAHRQWKGIIYAVVEGMDVEFNQEAATDHTKCGLGQWFYGPEGQKYASMPEMKEVEKWHIELHATIKQILAALSENDIQLIEALFNKLSDISEKVIAGLTATENAIARNSTHRTVTPSTAKPAPAKQISETKPAAKPATKKVTAAPSSEKLQTPAPSKKTHSDDEWEEF